MPTATPGTYTVTLASTGPGGTTTATKPSYISVAYPAPVASFTGSPTSGNAPLSVQFTNSSTGSIASYLWAFGDGGSSGAASPSHAYAIPGTYTVTLTVTGPGGTSTSTRPSYITANWPPPVPNFAAAPASGTAPLAVQFTNQTSGSVTNYQWIFGDGGSSTATSPSYTYATPGAYTVTLTATGPGGSAVASKVSYIAVNHPAPVANFAALVRSGNAPLAVQFNNQTTGTATGYQWSFGDGGTSTATDPSYSFATPGTYTVTLTSAGPGGTDVESKPSYITVSHAPPVPSFTGSPTSGNAPLVVQFSNQTTGNVTSYQWIFGDGGTSTAASPSHTYATPGTYTVTLSATGPGGTAVASKPSYIVAGFAAPVADFTASPTSGLAPLAVQFTNLTTGNASSYQWSFGDGGTSTSADPSHTYSAPGTYAVSLTATGPGGTDVESKSGYITVSNAPPVPGFTASPTSGTAPLVVQFSNQTTGNVTSYQWSFGDGSTQHCN